MVYDNVVYINLDRSKNRRQTMRSQLDKNGIVATRIAAIDGLQLEGEVFWMT